MSVWNSYFSVLCPSFSKMVVKFTMFFTFSSSSLVILGPASFPTRILLSLQTIDVQLALILLRTLITMLVTSTPPAPPFFLGLWNWAMFFQTFPFLPCLRVIPLPVALPFLSPQTTHSYIIYTHLFITAPIQLLKIVCSPTYAYPFQPFFFF